MKMRAAPPRGGTTVTKPQSSEMPKRLTSAFVLGAVALGAVLASPWTFLVLVIAGGVIVAWEWGRLTRGTRFDAIAAIQTAAVAAIAILVALAQPGLALFALAAAIVFICLLGLKSGAFAWPVAGLLYAALPAWSLVWLRGDPALGTIALLYLLAVAWTTDTASYVAGRLIGGPKLAPRLSPHKTWSGLIVGALAPAFVGYAFAVFLNDTSGLRLALVSVAISAACQLGDLSESAVKRHYGAKDMSQLIPGHGGVLDRIDGLLMAALAAAIIALRDPSSPGTGLLIW